MAPDAAPASGAHAPCTTLAPHPDVSAPVALPPGPAAHFRRPPPPSAAAQNPWSDRVVSEESYG
ncbi:hypothetical protein ABK046_36935 [Streptomyces caeruleatus]